jgi:hypothetical protein
MVHSWGYIDASVYEGGDFDGGYVRLLGRTPWTEDWVEDRRRGVRALSGSRGLEQIIHVRLFVGDGTQRVDAGCCSHSAALGWMGGGPRRERSSGHVAVCTWSTIDAGAARDLPTTLPQALYNIKGQRDVAAVRRTRSERRGGGGGGRLRG